MKKASFLIVFVFLLGMFSCSGGGGQKVEGEGPEVEAVFLRLDDGDPVVMLKNRTEKNIREIQGDFHFLDAQGEPVLSFIDRPKTFPFFVSYEPHLVEGGYQKELELPVIWDDKATQGTVTFEIIRFEDGTVLRP